MSKEVVHNFSLRYATDDATRWRCPSLLKLHPGTHRGSEVSVASLQQPWTTMSQIKPKIQRVVLPVGHSFAGSRDSRNDILTLHAPICTVQFEKLNQRTA
ncbi:hypothetical protein E2C01_061961 [Portunus trituberculatus]|uniref:Uncharacterized protein n=1 Tax=Portunus trituberculatus TaxID=210409 RepID=A0A5B7HEM5_PORTR|nr:hypothetical protein [Portunus trituberculatus]